MSSPSTEEGLTEGTSRWLEDHLDIVKKRIIRDASEAANFEERNIEPKDVAEAAKRFAPGFEIGSESARVSMVKAILSWTPSPILVSALLAVTFGVLGWRGNIQSAFDIAKVFAGAIVGSAAATARAKVT